MRAKHLQNPALSSWLVVVLFVIILDTCILYGIIIVIVASTVFGSRHNEEETIPAASRQSIDQNWQQVSPRLFDARADMSWYFHAYRHIEFGPSFFYVRTLSMKRMKSGLPNLTTFIDLYTFINPKFWVAVLVRGGRHAMGFSAKDRAARGVLSAELTA